MIGRVGLCLRWLEFGRENVLLFSPSNDRCLGVI